MKTLIDSSGWIEFFTGGPLSNKYESYLDNASQLITPTIVLYEVYKKIKSSLGEELALYTSAQLNSTLLIHLTESIALLAADLSLKHNLAMADAIVYATAQDQQAQLITSDSDLKGLPQVIYLPKTS